MNASNSSTELTPGDRGAETCSYVTSRHLEDVQKIKRRSMQDPGAPSRGVNGGTGGRSPGFCTV